MRPFSRWRLWVAAVLGITAAAKVVGVWAGAPLLRSTDTLTGLRLREVALILSVAELALAVYVWRARATVNVAAVVLFFAGMALAYRLLVLAPQGGRCPCLGGVGHWIRGLQEREETLLLLVLTWLALSAAGVLAHCVAGRQ